MGETKIHTFPKAEKLKSRKQIDLLFRKGKSFFAAPVKCYYRVINSNEQIPNSKTEKPILNQEEEPFAKNTITINHKQQTLNIECGFSVSKKQFKKAVDRNRIKRLMREAYRLHKHKLISQIVGKQLSLEIFFVFTDKTLPTFSLVEEKIKYALRRLGKIVEGNV